jgi:hypothetical protein
MKMKLSLVWVVVLLLAVVSSSCSKGGGTSTETSASNASAEALTLASKVSVVDAKLSGSVAAAAAPLTIGLFRVTAADLSAASDYNKDKTNVWVDERSTEALENINNILCMIGQTKYDAMLNQGNYIALVDNNVCNSAKSDASTAGQQAQNQSSGATMPNYIKFTVNSSRVDNNSPQIVKAWVRDTGEGNDKAALIYANITITEGKSDDNPYGIFSMSFAGYPLVNGVVLSDMSMRGVLRAVRSNPNDASSKVLLQFVSDDTHNGGSCGSESSGQQVTLDRSQDGSGGAGHVYQHYVNSCNSGTMEFDIAYNNTNFFRKDLIASGNPEFCMNRNSFQESSWSYGLYDSNGARVARNSGFPISYTPTGGTTHQGWVGYWGLWMDGNITIPDGATVNKMDYNNGSGTSTPYTIYQRSGKLKKHTRKALTLGEVGGIPLNYWEQPVSGGTGTQYQVVWNATTLEFQKVAEMPQNCSNGCTWKNITTTPTPTINVSRLQWNQLNFWSDSLSGQAMVTLGTTTSPCTYVSSTMGQGYTDCSAHPPVNATPVIVYTENVVYPGDATVPATLACFDNCPKATASGIDPNDPFVYNNMMSGPSQTAATYTFGNGILADLSGHSEVWTSGSSTNGSYQWGVTSGALFDPAYLTLPGALSCPWDPQMVCGWQAWSVLPSYYTWETGTNSWNQFVALTDPASGAFLAFDPPLSVNYVGNGTTYMMQYCGFGQLNGIPGKCVEMNTGADADCSQSQNSQSIRWVPAFTIPTLTSGNLTTVTDSSNNTAYFVKPLQVEQRMMKDPSGAACSTLSTTDFSAYTLPDISLWSDPVAANGAEPAVTSAPAVIGGVVQ